MAMESVSLVFIRRKQEPVLQRVKANKGETKFKIVILKVSVSLRINKRERNNTNSLEVCRLGISS